MKVPVMLLNSSPARWIDVPLPDEVTAKIRGVWTEQVRGEDGSAVWK